MPGGDSYLGTRIAAGIAGALFLFTGFCSFRFAWADILRSRADAASLREAVALSPLDSRTRYIEAAVLMAADPAAKESEAALRSAIELNPRNADAWMALGIQAESLGHAGEAEKYMLQAAAVDHTFKPAWTLANFYARSGDLEKFWQWIHTGLVLVEPRNHEFLTYDPQPMFELCWNVTEDAATILERAIPKNAYVLLKYVSYLRSRNRWDAAAQAAETLFPFAGADEYPVLLSLCDGLIANQRGAEAVKVWNALARRNLVKTVPLDPAHGISLTNAGFRHAPINDGFDWTFPRPGGVYDSYSPAGSFLKLEFDGEEPEDCDLLMQWAPLEAPARYRFEWKYEESGMDGAQNGLEWRIGAFTGHAPFEFTTSRDAGVERLALHYRRLRGTTQPKGFLKIYSASLKLLP